MQPAEEVLKTKDGVTLSYTKRGRIDAPVIVLLHGWSGSKEFFCRNVDALSEKFQVKQVHP